jgi:hypothetical protein
MSVQATITRFLDENREVDFVEDSIAVRLGLKSRQWRRLWPLLSQKPSNSIALREDALGAVKAKLLITRLR